VRGEAQRSLRSHVFLAALEEPDASSSLGLLQSGVRRDPAAPVSCAKPPVGGLSFISAGGEASAMLDAWWKLVVPEDSLPVLLMLHEDGLEDWTSHLDAEVVVGVPDGGALALYDGLDNVRAVVAPDASSLTKQAMGLYPSCFALAPAETTAAAPASTSDVPFTPFQPRPTQPPDTRPDHLSTGLSGEEAALHQRPAAAVTGPEPAWSNLAREVRALLGQVTGRRSPPPEELTALSLAHRVGRIVGVSSRSGGVGKTTVAAAVGIVYGEAVQQSGWCAAVVDQNIGNPDQWGRMSLTSGIRTVSEIMVDIEAGREWTVPAWNPTPALAVYPERRDAATPYTRTQVERFATRLRELHAMSVVDLPNGIPSRGGSSEATLSARWVATIDLLLLPTTEDPNRLQGLLDYLDVPLVKGDPASRRRPVPVVVPYLRSPLKAVREDPHVRATLDVIRRRVAAVVEIPRNERATLAIVKGQPITEVDGSLRDAYVELAVTIGRVLSA
jgi:MinD-like ATPase involved in chromosome partitioning or flagellar assembly